MTQNGPLADRSESDESDYVPFLEDDELIVNENGAEGMAEYARVVQWDEGNRRVTMDLESGRRMEQDLPMSSLPRNPEQTFRVLATSSNQPKIQSVDSQGMTVRFESDGSVRFDRHLVDFANEERGRKEFSNRRRALV